MEQKKLYRCVLKRNIVKITHLFIGIDFGTSYTKVSYSYNTRGQRHINTINWNGSFFKESILYIQDDKLYFEKPEKPFKDVKFFKYSLIDESLRTTQPTNPTKNNFEELCCVYFLTNIIKRSLEYIKHNLKLQSLDNISISINMGIPLDDEKNEQNSNHEKLYKDILEDSILLAGGSKIPVIFPNTPIKISNLDDVYSEILTKKALLNWNANVYPELVSEMLIYNNSRNVKDNVYLIIDIGGGTVDIALFKKDRSFNQVTSILCMGQKVLPYGAEQLKHLTPQDSEIFKQTLSTILTKAKKFENVNHYENQKTIPVFFLGGGADPKNNKLNWYKKNVEDTRLRLKNAGIPEFDFSIKIDNYINAEETLVQKNQRLIISQMLAKHNSEITKLQGEPIYFEKELEERTIRELNEEHNNLHEDHGDQYKS